LNPKSSGLKNALEGKAKERIQWNLDDSDRKLPTGRAKKFNPVEFGNRRFCLETADFGQNPADFRQPNGPL